MPHYPAGKLPHSRLDKLLGSLPVAGRAGVVLGPGIGEDAAAVRIGGRTLVVATDPVTFAAERVGWYAVHVNANDVAACGAQPRWFSACILLPERGPQPVGDIFRDITRACQELKVAVIGGHTEVTVGLDRPVVIGQMMGLAHGDRVVRSGGARVGHVIVLTKAAAIEATAIIARERGSQLRRRCPAGLLARAARFLFDPGISVVREAMIAARMGASGIHDPTEGGVLTGLWEMAVASDKQFVVDTQAVPVLPETRHLCELTGLDPLRSIGSGSLLVTIEPRKVDDLLRRLQRAGVAAARIGVVAAGKPGLFDSGARRITVSATDEIARL
ncbi:MAG TPA: AIR synthase family protein [Phycisphaerae bacterium]|nr:AIR synthase family protein [Phycisphaerae bacterium]